MSACIKCGSEKVMVKYVEAGSKARDKFDSEEGLMSFSRRPNYPYHIDTEHLLKSCECGYRSRVKTLDNKD